MATLLVCVLTDQDLLVRLLTASHAAVVVSFVGDKFGTEEALRTVGRDEKLPLTFAFSQIILAFDSNEKLIRSKKSVKYLRQ